MIFIDQMKNLKIYKRPMFLPTLETDKKKHSAVFLCILRIYNRQTILYDVVTNKANST